MSLRRPPVPRLVATALAALLLLLGLAACSTSGEAGTAASGSSAGDAGDESADGAVSEPEPAAPEAAAQSGQAREGDVAQDGGAPRVAPLERAVVSTGRLDVVVEDVDTARVRVGRLVRGWDGLVADEEASSDDDGRAAYSTLTVRVPSDRFDAAMAELGELGQVRDQTRSAKDVTTKVVDVAARVRAQERSVRRIEQLLAEAQDLGEVISIESNLARRQADLDSLKSQQASLTDQTSLSTITVGLDRRTAEPKPETEEAAGFLTGLDRGWGALARTATVAATSLGAVLPFAVVLALVGVPLWTVVRRRRSRPAPPTAEPA